MISSQSWNVWAKMVSTAARRYSKRLNVGRMIDTSGCILWMSGVRWFTVEQVRVGRKEFSAKRSKGQLRVEMSPNRRAHFWLRTRCYRHERSAEFVCVAARPQHSDCSCAGERTEGRNVCDDREQPTGKRLDQGIAASFPVAPEHEEVGCPHQLLDSLMGHPT